MASVKEKRVARLRRHKRVRKQVFGTPERPRLAVFKSSKHTYAQLIDDTAGSTLVSVSTTEPEIRENLKTGGNIEAAKKIGQVIAERAAQKDIKKAVFDRSGFLYHGRVKTVADTAREKGLDF